MICRALADLGLEKEFLSKEMAKLNLDDENKAHHESDYDGGHEHRSYAEVKEIIENSHIGRRAKQIAEKIYSVIAKAEAEVHGKAIEDVHFHEVGRNEAIRNIAVIGICLDALGVSEIYCSAIHDGTGFIECSHGRIPIPVPAVMAMRKDSKLKFVTEEIEMEMVTPSGLAAIIAMDAVYAEMPRGEIIAQGVGRGSRETGKDGLQITLFEISNL